MILNIRKAFSIQVIVFITLAALPLCALPFVELLADQAEAEKIRLMTVGLYVLSGIFFLLTIFNKSYDKLILNITVMLEKNNQQYLHFHKSSGKFENIIFRVFLLVIAAYTLVILAYGDSVKFLWAEDGITEWLTSIFYLVSTVICLVLRSRTRGYRFLRIHLLVLALLFFIVGMEEISWGQRLFDFATPELLKGANIQNEFTLHNIWSISLTTYPALVVVSCLLLVFPLMNRYGAQYRRLFSVLQFPLTPFPIALVYFAVVIAYAVIGLRLGTPSPLPISWHGVMPSADDEILEFFISFQFFVVAVGGWRIKLDA